MPPEWYRFMADMANQIASLRATLATVTGGEVQSVTVTQDDPLQFFFESPDNGTYEGLSQPYVLSVTAVHTQARQGTGSVQLLVDGEGVGPYVDIKSAPTVEAVSLEIPAGSSYGIRFANVIGLEKAAVTFIATRTLATE
jgi:hypothetical protein